MKRFIITNFIPILFLVIGLVYSNSEEKVEYRFFLMLLTFVTSLSTFWYFVYLNRFYNKHIYKKKCYFHSFPFSLRTILKKELLSVLKRIEFLFINIVGILDLLLITDRAINFVTVLEFSISVFLINFLTIFALLIIKAHSKSKKQTFNLTLLYSYFFILIFYSKILVFNFNDIIMDYLHAFPFSSAFFMPYYKNGLFFQQSLILILSISITFWMLYKKATKSWIQ